MITNKDLKVGQKATVYINGCLIGDCKINYENEHFYICHNVSTWNGSLCFNKYGYKYSWSFRWIESLKKYSDNVEILSINNNNNITINEDGSYEETE